MTELLDPTEIGERSVPQVTDAFLNAIKLASDSSAGGVSNIRWSNEAISIWAYRVIKLLRAVETRLDERANREISIRQSEVGDIRKEIWEIKKMGIHVHKEVALVKDKTMNQLKTLGENGTYFQEWWDALKSITAMIRPCSDVLLK